MPPDVPKQLSFVIRLLLTSWTYKTSWFLLSRQSRSNWSSPPCTSPCPESALQVLSLRHSIVHHRESPLIPWALIVHQHLSSYPRHPMNPELVQRQRLLPPELSATVTPLPAGLSSIPFFPLLTLIPLLLSPFRLSDVFPQPRTVELPKRLRPEDTVPPQRPDLVRNLRRRRADRTHIL